MNFYTIIDLVQLKASNIYLTHEEEEKKESKIYSNKL